MEILEDDCDFTEQASCSIPADCDVGFGARAVARLLPWLEAAWESDNPAPIDGDYVRFRRGNPDS